ncbi:DUF58 domain-containing protein [Suttonella ornithocola]|uniref:Uncharacterized conserved protein (Some members contain a von Willebrand factor type A (VWA) domain) n=1 Tax=Suttonella ornithocola TaxID=279832 RepID=A0A380MZ80_9GAMM|nr:DUF58 domain-containing protein [Suttonella ornithocola]SUO96991.1 Uncharacterized conserved protein (some members contain a von Willebrand factor type A (vWA) domain) [Suttonella ornithocola]
MKNGITLGLDECIQLRPKKEITGFAPSGRVATHLFGQHAALFKGRGMEFAESRPYQNGDDVRYMDWRVSARSGKLHTKLFQEERERPVLILLDLRAMMRFGSRVRFKSHLAAELAASFAWVAYDGGDRLGGLLLTDNGLVDFPLARTRKGVLRWLHAVSAGTEPPTERAEMTQTVPLLKTALQRLRHLAQTGSLLFIISDFHDYDATTAKELLHLSLHHHVTVVQVEDALDRALPSNGQLAISDGKASVRLGALGEAIKQYQQAFMARQAALSADCVRNGIAYHRITTEDDPQRLLYIDKKPRKQRRGMRQKIENRATGASQ